MCGICGAWVKEESPGLQENQIMAMQEALYHRGPDDGDLWLSEDRRVGLGSRRLAIIDLSPAGKMPLWNEDGTVGIVFNGECYNFEELREWLIERGHRFRSRTDTESVLHLYEESRTPEEMLGRLRGMYAFAIWDRRRGQLLLARDRLGIKPLYYSRPGGNIVFSSEVTSLLSSGMVSGELDPVGVQGYFALGASPLPYTPLVGVRSLPPGHYLLLKNGNEEAKPYWRIRLEEDDSQQNEGCIEQVREALVESVRQHLVADVPVGIFLSGGIDSSALVNLARHVEHQRVRTYTIIFEEKDYSEATFARQVAKTYETDHHEFQVSASDILGSMEPAIEAMDLPSWDGMNVYLVSKMTRSDGTVVALSGLGGDEQFLGYPSFHMVPRLAQWSRWSSAIPGASTLLGWASAGAYPGSRITRMKDLTAGADPYPAAYFAYRGLLDMQSLGRLLSPEFANGKRFVPVDYLQSLTGPLPAAGSNAVCALELSAWMHYQLLRDSDAMSMAHSLELRVPFLDHKLVELLARVPAEAKKSGGMPKALMLRALPTPLPQAVWNRPKLGFSIPFDLWLRGELKPMAEELLMSENSPLNSICHAEMLQQIWKGFLRGKVRWTRVWTAIVFARWLQRVKESLKGAKTVRNSVDTRETEGIRL